MQISYMMRLLVPCERRVGSAVDLVGFWRRGGCEGLVVHSQGFRVWDVTVTFQCHKATPGR